jgi:hypothetical protein
LIEAEGFPQCPPEQLICFRGDARHVSRYLAAKGYTAFYNPKRLFIIFPQNRMTIGTYVSAYNERISGPLERYGPLMVRTL